MSKWSQYDEHITKLYLNGEVENKGYTKCAKKILGKDAPKYDIDLLRTYIKRHVDKIENLSGSDSDSTEYNQSVKVLSAFDANHKLMNIDEYCEYYNLPRNDISSYKLVSHTGVPYYNIVFREKGALEEVDYDSLKEVLQKEITREYSYTVKADVKMNKEAVLKWADLHFGAHIRNLILTRDYDSNILLNGLNTSVDQTNDFGFKKVHVHINGDLIESFSGLNHINSWMSMDKNEVGADAIKLCTELLHRVLSRINNLGEIKIVSGNHDRTSKANDEDVKGGAANLIAWGLSLKGYNVEFHPYITTHLVEGINHINLHGDKGISKRSTKDIIWDYGIKGKYNFVFEAHLHSLIEKMSSTQREKFNVIRDDSIDHRRMHLQSFFTGNYYSETLNFNSNAGYCIVWDNGRGLPQVFNGCV